MDLKLNVSKKGLSTQEEVINEEYTLRYGHIFRGKSAYEYAVEGGFVGSEEEYEAYVGNIGNLSKEAKDVTIKAEKVTDLARSAAATANKAALRANEAAETFEHKQDELVSGDNIKMVAGQSILGSGDLFIPPTNQIWYTSVDSAIVEPFAIDVFGANIVSNTYENGKGVISFDGDVTKIGQDAFFECDKLTSVAIPDSVTEIGDRAFNKCYTLLNFRNSANLKSIGLLAFGVCFSLKDITIPEGVVSIGERAFISCRSLISITIPSSVTEIGTMVVRYCDSLATINSNLNDGKSNLLIANGVLLGVAPKSTLGFTIPSSVTEIGVHAFSDCSTLKGITIPEKVKKIGENAFNGCYSLTSITIPSSVTEVGYRAFYGCRSLESVTIGSNISSIGKEAFSGCAGHLFLNSVPYENYTATTYPLAYGWLLGSKFTKITIGSGISKIGTNTFCGYTGELEIASKILLETDYTSTTIPSDTGWLSGVLSPKITVGSGVSKIGSRALAVLISLKEVVLPNSVTEIREYAFNRCSSLQKITFGTSLTTIGNAAFKACGFTSLHIPDSVTSIGRFAFDNCSNLEKILLPNNSATTISGEAFYTTLKVLCSTSETPPTLTSALTVHKNCLVVVPKDFLDAYKKATNWSAKADAEKMVGSELIDYFDNELFWVLVRMELKIQNSILGGMLG